MGKSIDLTGAVVGRLTVVNVSHLGERNRKYWLCACECGGSKVLKADAITSGKTKSCGCLHSERAKTFRRTHGATSGGASRSYRIWSGMRSRCGNVNSSGYPKYGGAGIRCDDRWAEFTSFLEDMGECPSENHSLDRIDGKLGYHKENCRWATAAEQSRNQLTNLTVILQGERTLARDVAIANGIALATFKKRYYVYHWPLEQACGLSKRIKGSVK